MKSVLVTGGAGFVGSALALGLKARYEDLRVYALDNLHRRGSELNLPRLQEGGVTFLHGDIRNPGDLDEAGSFDLLLECSAEPSVLAGFSGSPQYVVGTNLTGTLHCLEAARRHDSAIIFLSTSRVYPMATLRQLEFKEAATRFELAADQALPGASVAGIAEDFPLAGTRSLYGATKLASELILAEYLEMYGLRGIVNRCGVITGPWQMGRADQGVVVLWAARHVFGGALQYIGYGGTGKQVRDLLHIDDLVELVCRQLDQMDTLSGATFNVGGGRAVSVSLQELTVLCEEATGNRIDISGEAAARVADVPLYLTDFRRVQAATGWEPRIGVAETVESICRWIEDHREALAPVLT